MARIIIRERDLTGNYQNTDFTDIAYVPGFVKTPVYEKDDAGSVIFTPEGNPILKCFNKPQQIYTSADFINLFGTEPASYTYTIPAADIKYVNNTAGNIVYKLSEDGTKYIVTVYDSAYVYARELLYRGIPVVYHQLNSEKLEGQDKTTELAQMFGTDTTQYCKWFEKILRDKLVDSEYTEQLCDRGMFSFKYLTTGGYPTFLVKDGILDLSKASMLKSAEELPVQGIKGWHYYYPNGKKYNLCTWEPSAEDPDHPWKTQTSIDILAEDKTTGITDESWKIMSALLAIAAEKEADDNIPYVDSLVSGRGDCIFIIDHENIPSLKALKLRDIAQTLKLKFSSTQLEYAAMFTPWCNYDLTFGYAVTSVAQSSKWMMPGSYAYLTCLADALQNYDNWNAIAGVARGTVQHINNILLDHTLTNTMANKCQGDPEETTRESKDAISINCITEIKPYGQVIWGNRTLQIADNYKHVTAMGFLNLRNEVSDIRKLCYKAARRWMFEQNSALLWSNFAGMITPLLDKMKTGYGISRYELIKGSETKKHKLYAKLRIWPIYAVEMFDITIEILDEEAEVTQG